MRLVKETLMRAGSAVMAGIMVFGLAGCRGELNQADHLLRRIREQSRLGAARHHRMPLRI